MNNVKTNDYIVNEIIEGYDNQDIEEVKKIVSIHKNGIKASRDFVIKNSTYTNEEKIMYLDILDSLNNVNVRGKLKTTNYEGKVYSFLFIREFVNFLRNPSNNFTFSEFKLLLTIYEMIVEANAISNVLVGVKKKYLAEQAGIGYKNLNKVFHSLKTKNILKEDENGSLYINCEYFFMGNSMNYDLYKVQYENIASQEQEEPMAM